MNRLAILVVVSLIGGPVLAACGGGPYEDTPERLHRPRAKKRPEGKTAPTEVAEKDAGKPGQPPPPEEACRTNFFGDPFKGKRNPGVARGMARDADTSLVTAEKQEGPQKQATVVQAMGQLTNALKIDPFGPQPTFKLAVAYAMVGKKNCSLALLGRLKALRDTYPDPNVVSEAERTIQQAATDPAFKTFERDAKQALGM